MPETCCNRCSCACFWLTVRWRSSWRAQRPALPAVAGVYMAVELSRLPEFSVEMHRACVHCLPLSQLAYSRLVALPGRPARAVLLL